MPLLIVRMRTCPACVQMILSRIRELDPTPPSTDALTKMTNKTDTLKCTAGTRGRICAYRSILERVSGGWMDGSLFIR